MSVPKDKRTEGELAINSEARGLCKHLLQILWNEKNFPKAQEWFTNKLRETALDIDLKCWKANNIRVDKSEELYTNQAWRTHASKGNNFHLIQRMDEYYKALWAEGENNGNDSKNGYSSERDV